MIHGIVLTFLAASSLLHVEPLGKPSLPAERLVVPKVIALNVSGPAASSPVPSPPSGGGAPAASRREERAAPESDATVVQPLERTDTPAPASGDGEGHAGQGPPFPGGIPDGVPGGVPGAGPGGDGGGGGGRGALAGLPSTDEPLLLGADVSPPERIVYVQPVYPETARRSRTEGTVILEIVVGATEDVTQVTVTRSHPLLDASAVEAVKRWKYRPAMLGSRPVKVFMTIRVEFRLR